MSFFSFCHSVAFNLLNPGPILTCVGQFWRPVLVLGCLYYSSWCRSARLRLWWVNFIWFGFCGVWSHGPVFPVEGMTYLSHFYYVVLVMLYRCGFVF